MFQRIMSLDCVKKYYASFCVNQIIPEIQLDYDIWVHKEFSKSSCSIVFNFIVGQVKVA